MTARHFCPGARLAFVAAGLIAVNAVAVPASTAFAQEPALPAGGPAPAGIENAGFEEDAGWTGLATGNMEYYAPVDGLRSRHVCRSRSERVLTRRRRDASFVIAGRSALTNVLDGPVSHFIASEYNRLFTQFRRLNFQSNAVAERETMLRHLRIVGHLHPIARLGDDEDACFRGYDCGIAHFRIS